MTQRTRTLLNGTDFKLEWYYQQISTAVEYLSILATILRGGGGGNLPINDGVVTQS